MNSSSYSSNKRNVEVAWLPKRAVAPSPARANDALVKQPKRAGQSPRTARTSRPHAPSSGRETTGIASRAATWPAKPGRSSHVTSQGTRPLPLGRVGLATARRVTVIRVHRTTTGLAESRRRGRHAASCSAVPTSTAERALLASPSRGIRAYPLSVCLGTRADTKRPPTATQKGVLSGC